MGALAGVTQEEGVWQIKSDARLWALYHGQTLGLKGVRSELRSSAPASGHSVRLTNLRIWSLVNGQCYGPPSLSPNLRSGYGHTARITDLRPLLTDIRSGSRSSCQGFWKSPLVTDSS